MAEAEEGEILEIPILQRQLEESRRVISVMAAESERKDQKIMKKRKKIHALREDLRDKRCLKRSMEHLEWRESHEEKIEREEILFNETRRLASPSIATHSNFNNCIVYMMNTP